MMTMSDAHEQKLQEMQVRSSPDFFSSWIFMRVQWWNPFPCERLCAWSSSAWNAKTGCRRRYSETFGVSVCAC